MQASALTINFNNNQVCYKSPTAAALCKSPSAAALSANVTPNRTPNVTPNRSPNVTPNVSPAHQAQLRPSAPSAASTRRGPAAVSVVAPGGGTGINHAVYTELGQDPRFNVEIVGRSRAAYDCYPPEWSHGGPPPNLATFAEDVYRQGWVEKSDLFVFGSRGGQVVLPSLWQRLGERMPPAVVINGGCAMNLPRRIHWPDSAITFLLIGGQDNFRGNATVEEYIAETRKYVPQRNGTTAILYVSEMGHMPQGSLLRVVLPLMLRALQSWKAKSAVPKEDFRQILAAVNTDGWSGRLMFTKRPGQWAADVDFGPFHVARHIITAEEAAVEAAPAKAAAPVEMTRKEELKVLFRAAAQLARPGADAPPLSSTGARFHAAAQAASAAQHRQTSRVVPQGVQTLPASPARVKPTLPIPAAGATHRQSAAMLPARSPEGSPITRTPTANRLCVPTPVSRGHCDPTPISKALGMGRTLSPSKSEFTSPSPSCPNSLSPTPQHYFMETSPVRAEW